MHRSRIDEAGGKGVGVERRAAEKIIVFIYSIYAVALMFATTILGWPGLITPITSVGILTVWIVYLREIRDYRFRALLYSAVVLATFVLYNTQEDSFGGILTTYCAAVVVLSILDIPEIVVPEYVFSVLLVAYHGLAGDTIPHATTQEKIRSAVQILSVFAVVGITHHLIKKHEAINQNMRRVIANLKEAEQGKMDFLVNVSHEIRTPVDTICGSSEMILGEEIPEGVREGAQSIQAAGRNLLSMIGDVQLFSELESEKTALAEEPYNLASTINDVIQMAMAYKGSKDLEIIVDCSPNMPCTLLGDEQKLRRVILNLVNNAVKFTEAGCVTIAVSTRPEQYGVNLCVKVKDTGIGIAEEVLEKLFAGFNQADAKRDRQKGGIGIGLAISKRIVSRMDGFISVKSELGKGSEFQFVVPQKVVDPRPIVTVRNAESINIIFYIDTEKESFTEIRDNYLSSICHMMEGLEVRYHQCRNLGEFKRRTEREIFTHALITQNEYMEDPAYFDRLSGQLKIIMMQDGGSDFAPGGSIGTIHKPFYALSFAAALNESGGVQRIDGAYAPADKPVRAGDSRDPREEMQAQKPGKRARIDREKGIRLMGGDPDVYREILQVYLSEGREVFEKLQEKYRAEDWKHYTILVHSLKSNSLGIGAEELGEMAKALEAAGREGNIGYIQARHGEMMQAFREVLSEIGGDAAPRPYGEAGGIARE